MAILLSPSILAADLTCLSTSLKQCEEEKVDHIHIDVMDGRFVPNITFGPNMVKACHKVTSIPLCVHLMIIEPEKYLEQFAQAGASRILVHYETCPHIHRTLQMIKELGVAPGIAINPGTPVEVVYDLVGMFDLVLVMSVNPGFGGQAFIPQSLERIRKMRNYLDKMQSPALIQVDGGIDKNTIPGVVHAGATDIVAGTSIFQHPQGIKVGIQALRAGLLL